MSETKHMQVYHSIKAQIEEGFWKPGGRLYSERQLSELYGVSRMTVKRALMVLISEGLLEYKSGRKGTFVTDAVLSPTDASPANQGNYIGVAIDNFTPTFASHLLQGIHDSLWYRGFQTVYCNTYLENDQIIHRMHSLLESAMKGIIFSPVLGPGSDEINTDILDAIHKKGVPVILVDRYLPDRLDNHVVINNREVFYNITQKLLRMGHQRVLYVNGYEATSSSDRYQGFLNAFRTEGADTGGALSVEIDEKAFHLSGKVSEPTLKRVASLGDFTAIVGLNQQLLQAGKQIAEKLDKTVVTATIAAGPNEGESDITAIQPIYEMGKEAANLVVSAIENNGLPVTHLILKAELVDRSSRR